MDQVFLHCADLIALSGSSGTSLFKVAETVLGTTPNTKVLTWLASQFKLRQDTLFSIHNSNDSPEKLHVVACENLRRRALGFSSIEHPQLPAQSWNLLQQIGAAGPNGILQSELAPLVKLSPVMINHYITTLCSRGLVAKLKVVRKSKRLSEAQIGNNNEKEIICEDNQTSITYTAVVVLARFAAILSSSKTKLSLSESKSTNLTAHGTMVTENKISVVDLAVNSRLKRILEALRDPPHARAERDLKYIAFSDFTDSSQSKSKSSARHTEDQLIRRRHRGYRAMRAKLLELGYVTITLRNCEGRDGVSTGEQSCLELTQAGKDKLLVSVEKNKSQLENTNEIHSGTPNHNLHDINSQPTTIIHPKTNINLGKRSKLIAEVDVAQQVYHLIEEKKSSGISVPEIKSFLNGEINVTAVGTKRIRNIIAEISKRDKTVEEQKFDGSAMSLLFSFSRFGKIDTEIDEKSKCKSNAISKKTQDTAELGEKSKPSLGVRRSMKKSGMTSLGEKRKEIVLNWLLERRAMPVEPLGRELANAEGSGLVRIDQKVLNRIIDVLYDENRLKLIKAVKPGITASQKSHEVKLIALPEVTENSPEVRAALQRLSTRATADRIQNKTQRLTGISKVSDKKVKKLSLPHLDPSKSSIESYRVADEGVKLEDLEKTQKVGASKEALANSKHELSNIDQKRKSSSDININNEIESIAKPLCVEQKRDYSISQVCRLRAIDHGWMKGRLSRANYLHRFIFTSLKKQEQRGAESTYQVYQSTVETSNTVPPIGPFSIYSCLRLMTVREYASVIGLYFNHSTNVESLYDQSVADVAHTLRDELNSSYASRQTTSLLQILDKLGLVQVDMNGNWILQGSGLIRDFGKGLPLGVIPHGIIFKNEAAVDVYWKELKEFSYARLIQESPDTNSSQFRQDTINDTKASHVREVHLRSVWKQTGQYRFLNSEQLVFEVVLQRLCKNSITFIGPGRISVSDLITTQLRSFSVEELHEEIIRLFQAASKSLFGGRLVEIVEHLMYYSRFRSRNCLAQSIQLHSGILTSNISFLVDPKINLARGTKNSKSLVTKSFTEQKKNKVNDKVDDKDSYQKKRLISKNNEEFVLKVSRDPLVLDLNNACRPSVKKLKKTSTSSTGNLTNVLRSNDKITQGDPKITRNDDKDTRIESIDVNEFIEYLVVIVLKRALAYVLKDNEISNWKNVSSIIQNVCEGRGRDANVSERFITPNAIRKPLTVLLGCGVVRCSLDILAMQLAVDIYKEKYSYVMSEGRDSISYEEIFEAASSILRQRKSLDLLLKTIVMEARADVKIQIGVDISSTNDSRFTETSFRSIIIEKAFQLSGKFRLRGGSIGQMLILLVSRYRRVLELRFKSRIRSGIIFSLEETNDGHQSRDKLSMNKLSLNETRTAQQPRRELLEQVVLGIVQLPQKDQQSVNSENQLKEYKEEELSAARDELILRGSINFNEEKGRAYFTISNRRLEKSLDIFQFLYDSDVKGRSDLWKDVHSEQPGIPEKGRLCLERKHFWQDIGSGSNVSNCGYALYKAVQRTFFPTKEQQQSGFVMQLLPEWKFDGMWDSDKAGGLDEEPERIVLYGKTNEEQPYTDNVLERVGIDERLPELSQSKQCASDLLTTLGNKVECEDSKDLVEHLLRLVRSEGNRGLTLKEILQDEYVQAQSPSKINKALERVANLVRRVAIETKTSDQDWCVGEGALFLETSKDQFIGGWHERAKTQVSQCIIKVVGRMPGIALVKLATEIVALMPAVSRQMVMDQVVHLAMRKMVQIRRTKLSKEGSYVQNVEHFSRNDSVDVLSLLAQKDGMLFVEAVAGMETE